MTDIPAEEVPWKTVVASWLLRQLGPPPPPPRRYFSKAVYSRPRVTRSRRPIVR